MVNLSAACFDTAALLDKLERTYEPRTRHGQPNVVTFAARLIGVDRAAIYAAAKRGLEAGRADEWAMRCGFHPSEVWSTWFTPSAYNAAMTNSAINVPLHEVPAIVEDVLRRHLSAESYASVDVGTRELFVDIARLLTVIGSDDLLQEIHFDGHDDANQWAERFVGLVEPALVEASTR